MSQTAEVKRSLLDVIEEFFLNIFRPEILKERKEREKQARIMKEKSSLPLLQLLEKGYLYGKEVDLIMELIEAFKMASEINRQKYQVWGEDNLFVGVRSHDGSPHYMPFTNDFNLRLRESLVELKQALEHSLAESILFLSTGAHSHPIRKSTKTEFCRSDLEPNITLLEIFHKYRYPNK